MCTLALYQTMDGRSLLVPSPTECNITSYCVKLSVVSSGKVSGMHYLSTGMSIIGGVGRSILILSLTEDQTVVSWNHWVLINRHRLDVDVTIMAGRLPSTGAIKVPDRQLVRRGGIAEHCFRFAT